MERSQVAGLETINTKHTSLALATIVSVVSFSFAFVQAWTHSFGLETLPRIGAALDHPQALSELIAQAIGGSLVLPTLHVGIAFLFKSKRNPSSRRRIFIGWGIFIIAVSVLALLTK